MLLVGLTGGYATGKSFVAKQFERLGCKLIYADELGHRVLEPDGPAYSATVELFGEEILKPDKHIDRKKLGSIVFESPEMLEKLTSIVHPAVFGLQEAMISQLRRNAPGAVVMIEAAILIETGRHTFFDRLILTNCATETQIARGMTRDGVTREQAMARINRQLPFARKAEMADFIINTEGTEEETVHQVEAIFPKLAASPARGRP